MTSDRLQSTLRTQHLSGKDKNSLSTCQIDTKRMLSPAHGMIILRRRSIEHAILDVLHGITIKLEKKAAPWFDRECREKRSEALKAGQFILNPDDKDSMLGKCREYKACKQRKRRQYCNANLKKIEEAFQSNRGEMWKVINSLDTANKVLTGPSPQDFMRHFTNLASSPEADYFDNTMLKTAVSFLEKYDAGELTPTHNNKVELELINDNFTVDEIRTVINSLKNNKSPGIDRIPAEVIKTCKEDIHHDITNLFNYVIEMRDFPAVWSEGLRSPVYKGGDINDTKNYRGITVLSIFGKLFEMLVHNRLAFANEAFSKIDKFNGGFLKGQRTADNIFMLKCIIERQLILGKPLFVCYVDFSKAFDLINRHILFYKIMRSGWHGRVVDTMRSLYRQTYFRLKCNGLLSASVLDELGVNQGGNASGLLFRKYLGDLSEYLKKEVGICVDDEILAHILWADDLLLLSDTCHGLQKQLDGLQKFCALNFMIVNEIKTKVMVFGKIPADTNIAFYFNGKVLNIVNSYKYLGNIVQSVRRHTDDIFGSNYDFLCNKARKAMFGACKKLKVIGAQPPHIMCYVYESVVQPILTYGSDIWGVYKGATVKIDKMFHWFMRYALKVKGNTDKNILSGECGVYPPSIHCHSNVLIYFNRVSHMPNDCMMRKAYNALFQLHSQGFRTWVSRVCELAEYYGIRDILFDRENFKQKCKLAIRQRYQNNWLHNINNTEEHPVLRTYKTIKTEFKLEPYLRLVKDFKYRHAITKIRTSSHNLEIERGRYNRPKTPIEQRLCFVCNCVESELHFMTACDLNSAERETLYSRIISVVPSFTSMDDTEKFVYMLTNDDARVLTWVGKFIYKSLFIRSNR